MSNFAATLDQATEGENPEVLGIVALAVDRDGNRIFSHSAGKAALDDSAKKISPDTVLLLASCTKIVTTIAALSLVQQGTLSLDDSSLIEKHLPELHALDIIISTPGEPLAFEKRRNGITLRQLLTHTSGSAYDILDSRLQAWRQERGESPLAFHGALPDAICSPGLFQPGEGWVYGGSSDWMGLLVSRVTGKTLGEVLKKEVFDPLGCDGGIGFWRRDVEKAGLVTQVATKVEGKLAPYTAVEQRSERGGGGLFGSPANFLKVLSDIVSPTSKILDQTHLDLLFAPQLQEGGPALSALRTASPIFNSMTGALSAALPASALNHSLGGLLISEDNPELGRTKGTIAWGGAFNWIWFANREVGVAGVYASNMFPPAEKKSTELMGGFVREVWRRVGGNGVQ